VLTIHQHLVRKSTCLRALAAIGAATAQRFARQALTGVSYAKCTMNEDFQRHRSLIVNRGDFFDGKFAGENDALYAKM